jgi:hypothetical protein
MQTIATIGLDIAKSVFQVHGVDASGRPPSAEASARIGGILLMVGRSTK